MDWMELEPERHGAPTTRPDGRPVHLSYVHRVRNVLQRYRYVRAAATYARRPGQVPRLTSACMRCALVVASSHHGSTDPRHNREGNWEREGEALRCRGPAAAPCRAVPLLWPSHAAVAAFDAIHPSNNTGATVSVVPRAAAEHRVRAAAVPPPAHHSSTRDRGSPGRDAGRIRFDHFPGSSSPGTAPWPGPPPRPRARSRQAQAEENQSGRQGDIVSGMALACIESGGSALRARSVLGAVAVGKAGPRLFSLTVSASVTPASLALSLSHTHTLSLFFCCLGCCSTRVKLTGAGSKPHLSPQQP